MLASVVAPSDAELFYRGTLTRYSLARNEGVVRSSSGREVQFDLRFVRLCGGLQGRVPEVKLSEGLAVGFDVGWTSRGLRVSKMFPVPSGSERETGKEGEVPSDEGTGQNEDQLDIE